MERVAEIVDKKDRALNTLKDALAVIEAAENLSEALLHYPENVDRMHLILRAKLAALAAE